ncbi:sigma-B regulation protein RsbQ [Actimicrobium sp. GrIS 1.19]|uniref:alpha/beta fold hydrolase n=1 Tax=Actimicrobium sp. GrIS 1.19 TaxID=3071708 RepID=UPI002DF8A083|nr:sigma-B regulation protein RsbQ [Actimicrobium sp. GrIS 1.19]
MSDLSADAVALSRNNVDVIGTEGPVLLYAHGFGCNQHMWDRVAAEFRTTHRQVLFDYVGSGRSDITAFDPVKYGSLDGYVQDLLDVCDALGLKSGVTFIGHSVSCSVGIMASIARPELFDKLVLLGPNPCFVNHPPDYVGGFDKEDLEGLLALMDQNYMGWVNFLAPVVSAQSETGAVTMELADSFCSTDPLIAKTFARTTFFSDNRADLVKVSRPCLVLQHRTDSLAPVAVGDYVHAHLAGSTLQMLEVQGHCAHMSDPLLVAAAIRAFIGGTA